MLEFLKLLFSKEFISNAKEIVEHWRKSKEWKKDITIYSGQFKQDDKDEVLVLIDKSASVLEDKDWLKEEIKEIRFIATEIVTNALYYGIKDPNTDIVSCKFILTSSYAKLMVTDSSVDFDLMGELKRQGAFSTDKYRHRGLSFVCRITPDIHQIKKEKKNTIIVIKRSGVRPLSIKKIDEVIVFNLGDTFEGNFHALEKLIAMIKELNSSDRVVINLSDVTTVGSRCAWEITKNFKQIQDPSKANIIVCGLENSTFAIKEYLEDYFMVVKDLDEAIDYFEQEGQ